MTLAETFNLAVQRHQAGDLDGAQDFYRQILTQDAAHADALHGLGLLAHQRGRDEQAKDFIKRAIALKPAVAYYHLNLGSVLTATGRLDEAIAALEKALELQPAFAQAYYNLGNALCDKREWHKAAAAYHQALKLRPDHADTQFNLACALQQLGEIDPAIAAARGALALRPEFAEAHHLLGLLLRACRRTEEAIDSYRRALALRGDWPELLNNFATALCEAGQYAAAADALRRGAILRPQSPEIYNNLGAALRGQGLLDEAEGAYRQALDLRPGYIEARNNLAGVFHARGQLDQAAFIHRQILAGRPDYAQAHWDLSLILLTQGDYEQAWREYEWRWRVPELRLGLRLTTARWDGGELHGKTILLHGEQGLGDALQFARFVPMVAERGGKIILLCRPELVSLFETLPGVTHCLPDDQPPPAHDVHCPLLSLPGLFKTTLRTIPCNIPYLSPAPALVEQWRGRIPPGPGRKIGLVWAGKSYPDPFRSVPLELLAPLGKIPGIHYISLQTSDAAYQQPPAGLELTSFTADLKDLAQTAALIAHLDLVITIDTATAHLAGAMGKPTWVLLKSVPDWRWMLSGDRCAWYPTMRLFRQTERGQWNKPVALIAGALQ